MGLKKNRKDRAPRDPVEPTQISRVAQEITTLVQTAETASAVAVENAELVKELKTAKAEVVEAVALASGYAEAADGITAQDLANLVTLRANVTFRQKFTKGVPEVTIEGTGRRKVKTKGTTFAAALASLRPLMSKVPGRIELAGSDEDED